jgi:hypothetical protein
VGLFFKYTFKKKFDFYFYVFFITIFFYFGYWSHVTRMGKYCALLQQFLLIFRPKDHCLEFTLFCLIKISISL